MIREVEELDAEIQGLLAEAREADEICGESIFRPTQKNKGQLRFAGTLDGKLLKSWHYQER